ncbi:type IX secretion system periplasmic lipoprotein PorW/SprE [Robertkochia aurantiaca]|uniref:type IX secretion system periplasmic lipoprotein PorW/SprE n=1 Tax=Robertkochia aurantiaca TaxID=2873700 RepID=UPI001CCBF940|nr:hypothetical protein [Robertkochia sp. 3YJGBD-33]
MNLPVKFLSKIPALVFLVFLVTAACSTRKDAMLNRKWHGLNTKYNVMYNGKNALEKGRQDLIDQYSDNFWEVLPVERMKVSEQVKLDGVDLDPDFERAEEKAVKAVQKHGMYIGGEEKNSQIDEAYLLLGKARYYDQRFIPALEAFNYILNHYSEEEVMNKARIWREKTYMRLDNDELALSNLKKLMKYADLDDQDYADANAAMGQAYMNLERKDSAVQRLKLAANYTKSSEEEGRYLYIIGQLYNEMEKPDSANMAFEKVIDLNRRTLRPYYMNAWVEKINNLNQAGHNKEELLEMLSDLERNRENRPYLARIYRQKALYFVEQDTLELARKYYDRSLQSEDADSILKSLNYRELAQLAFDERRYETAGAYYDSTLAHMTGNTKEFRSVKRKRENLEEVIVYENVAQRNDSILNLLAMEDEELQTYFRNYIDSLQQAEEEALEQAKLEALKQMNQGGGIAGSGPKSNGGFYFYNQETVRYGIQAFRSRWGNRELQDNWRYGGNVTLANTSVIDTSTATIGGSSEEIYEVSYYTDQLPQTPEAIDSIQNERNFAYYQLGLLYKEKFQEYGLAASRLEALLDSYPEERLIVPAKYNLFKIYQALEVPLEDAVRNDILENHPDSRYAAIIRDPQAILGDDNASEEQYRELRRLMEAQQYERVAQLAEKYASDYNGRPVALKFELMKANALARLKGLGAYKEALNYIALNHPNTEEGKAAAEILEQTIPALEDLALEATDPGDEHWKLIFPFRSGDESALTELEEVIKRSLVELEYDKVRYSKDFYTKDSVFLVVHGLGSKLRAEGYAELLHINKDYLIDNENFVISRPNYKVIQVKKNLDEYLNKFQAVNPNLK